MFDSTTGTRTKKPKVRLHDGTPNIEAVQYNEQLKAASGLKGIEGAFILLSN